MKIASFNVQRFGRLKVSDPNVLSTLVKIVSRYDVIVILEVADMSGSSVQLLLHEVNRDDVVDLIESYQYEDNQVDDLDAFAREPYVLHFKPRNTVLKDLVVIPVHVTQLDTKKELDELYEVFLAVRDKWKIDNIMILGDFKADGVYMSHNELKEIRIRRDKNFHWLIGDEVDTTTKTSNDHSYDRIVVYGEDMLAAIVPHSAKAFNFQKEFAITEEMALKVSDHYPVEVELHNATPFWQKTTAKKQEKNDDAHTLPVNTEALQDDLLKLQKENLLLEREKLQLEISYLKHQLSLLKLDEYQGEL